MTDINSNSANPNKAFDAIRGIKRPLTLRQYRDLIFCNSDCDFGKSCSEVLRLSEKNTFPGLRRLSTHSLTPSDAFLFRRFLPNPLSPKKKLDDLFPKSLLTDPELKSAIEAVSKLLEIDEGENKWQRFRRLLGYYKDVLIAENHSLYFAARSQDENFSCLQFMPDRKIAFDDNNGCFIEEIVDTAGQTLAKVFESERKHISFGYPLEVTTNKNGEKVVKPIFFITYECGELRNGVLHLKVLQGTKPDVNADWIQNTFTGSGSEKAKYSFLKDCGIVSAELEATNDEYLAFTEEYGRASSGQSFAKLASVVESRLPDKVREHLNSRLLKQYTKINDLEDGIYNVAIIGQAIYSPYTSGVIEDLDRIAASSDEELEKTALNYLFNPDATDNSIEMYPELIVKTKEFPGLNRLQEEAVCSMVTSPVSLLQGPPGTGKTQVITSVVLNLRLLGKSALIISKNHQAVKSALGRMSFSEEERELVTRGVKPRDDEKEPFLDFEKANNDLNCLNQTEIGEFNFKREHFLNVSSNLINALSDKDCFDDLSDQIDFYQKSLQEILKLKFANLNHSDKFKKYIDSRCHGSKSPQYLSEGLSLLEKTRNNNIAALLELFCRFLTRYRANKAIKAIGIDKKIIVGSNKYLLDTLSKLKTLDDIFLRLSDLYFKYNGLEKKATTIDPKQDPAQFFNNNVQTALDLFSDTADSFIHTDAVFRMKQTIEDKTIITEVNDGLREYGGIKGLVRLKKEQPVNYHKVLKACDAILRTHPVWACTTLSVPGRLPFVPGLFDELIVDEAGQCDYISAIPALFRAKRIAVVGDPQQLKPIFNLTHQSDLVLIKKHGFNTFSTSSYAYTGNSLYSFVQKSPFARNIKLRDSYRSCAAITSYIGKIGYGNELVSKASIESFNIPNGFEPGIIWRNVEGTSFRKDTSKYVPLEAEKTIEILKDIFSSGYDGSVGVISPYRPHAEYIDELLRKEPELSKLSANPDRLVIATAHKFQGSERDVIILNLCLDISGRNSFITNDLNLINVAVSRAKALLIVVGNQKYAANCEADFIRLLAKPEEAISSSGNHKNFDSPYEQMMFEALVNEGFQPEIQKEVGRRRLDLALIDGSRKLDIEIDGRCHMGVTGIRKADDYRRDDEMRQHGYAIIRILTSEIRDDLDQCVENIKNAWNELKNQENN